MIEIAWFNTNAPNPKVEINFIGSVAHFLSKDILEALKRNNLKAGSILKNPIKKLIDYHFKKFKL